MGRVAGEVSQYAGEGEEAVEGVGRGGGRERADGTGEGEEDPCGGAAETAETTERGQRDEDADGASGESEAKVGAEQLWETCCGAENETVGILRGVLFYVPIQPLGGYGLRRPRLWDGGQSVSMGIR